MSLTEKEDDVHLDKNSKKLIHSMAKAKMITPEFVEIVKASLPLLKYKFKTENKKPIVEWYAEIIMLLIGAFLSVIITNYNTIYLIVLIILLISRVCLYMKVGW